jgi:quinol monooxygenase YgiN
MKRDGADITVLIEYQAQPGQGETAGRELAALTATVVSTEPDCRGIRLLRDAADADRLLLIEQWTSEAAFTGPHMTTPHLQAFMQRAPGFLAGPPQIRIWREVAAGSAASAGKG